MKHVIYFLLFTLVAFAQQPNYPTDYFASPLEVPLHLSGSFGELRNNHFHSGLDFKTQQKEGLNVLASADGYISRIKVSTWGNGKALYINHPNGYTTVYCHLQKFAPEIEAYVKSQQYSKKSFEVEFFPSATQFKVKKGDLIAYSGNTGGSGGPHLHFEIRDTKTENTINPMHFGFNKLIADTKKPTLNNVYIYPIGENSYANSSEVPTTVNLSLQKDGTYLSQPIPANGKVAFGVNAYDLFDFNWNKNGVYAIETSLNGNPEFNITFSQFAFSETRYLNNYIDYAKLKKQKTWIQKLFVENKYPLSLISGNKKSGIIDIQPNLTYNYKIVISDYHENTVTVIIPLKYSIEPPKIKKENTKTDYFLKAKIDNIYEKENITVNVPANTFYNDFDLLFHVKDDVLTFADSTIPVHKNYSITFNDSKIAGELRKKTFIASIEGNSKKYNKTEVTPTSFKTFTRNIGKFLLVQDTIAPKVRPLNFSQGNWISSEKFLRLAITDDLSGIDTYEAYLNNEWILMEYEYKTNEISHDFTDGKVREGKNDLKVIVKDNVGNSTTFETHFFRSQK